MQAGHLSGVKLTDYPEPAYGVLPARRDFVQNPESEMSVVQHPSAEGEETAIVWLQ